MHDAVVPALLSVGAVSLVSFAGASVLALGPERLRSVLPALVALAAGALLGDAFLHLLPEAVDHAGGFTTTVAWGTLGGLLGFFLIEQVIHWHHHGEDIEPGAGHVHHVAWMNLLGDMIHNFVDGMLIAGTWLVGPEAGLATTVAVAFHEVPQEFGDFGVLLHAGFTPRRALFLNFVSACAAIVGAVLVLLLESDAGLGELLTPIAAGGFLYVACADLVPELRARARGKALIGVGAALALGVVVIALLGFLPHGHEH
jgi:zinc and cadmium transporter